jgi:hypothetical protein
VLATPRHRCLTANLQTAVNFGLINQTYPSVNTTNATQWQQFTKVVESLNSKADLNTVYKVLFMGRHGEGFHNAAESYYGTPSWNVSSLVFVNITQTLLTTPISATGPNSTATEQQYGPTQT